MVYAFEITIESASVDSVEDKVEEEEDGGKGTVGDTRGVVATTVADEDSSISTSESPDLLRVREAIPPPRESFLEGMLDGWLKSKMNFVLLVSNGRLTTSSVGGTGQ